MKVIQLLSLFLILSACQTAKLNLAVESDYFPSQKLSC